MGFFDLPASVLFTGILVSSIGVGLFLYGKKQRRWPQLLAGFVLVCFPFFVTEVLPMVGIAAGVITLLWWGVRSGL